MLDESLVWLAVALVALALIFEWLHKAANIAYHRFWILDINKFPSKALDIYVQLSTRSVPVQHQYLSGQDRIHETRGSTFTVKWPGSLSVYTADPDNIWTVWSFQFGDWESGSVRFPVVGEFVGRAIVTTDGNRWTEVRQVAKHALAGDEVTDFMRFKAVADKHMDHLPGIEDYIDLQPFLFDTYFEACFVFLMGRWMIDTDLSNIGCSLSNMRALLDNGMRIAKTRSSLGPLRYLYRRSDWAKSTDFANLYSDYAAREGVAWREEALTDHTQPDCLIQRLALTFPLREDLKNEILHFTIGTHSTVSGLLTQTCLQLARRPDIWRWLHEEVCDAKFDALGKPDMATWTLLHNVLMEGLRLYPSTAFAFRTAVCHTSIPTGGGFDRDDRLYIPRGTRIVANVYALHRNEEIYGANPCTFDPDRWNTIKPRPWDFMPFSRGHRVCLGKAKALREAKYMLFKMVQKYKDIKTCESTTFVESTNGIPLSCRVVLVPA